MEHLIAEIQKINADYAAVQWKQRLIDEGVTSVARYREWLSQQTPNEQIQASARNAQVAAFLNGKPLPDAPAIRESRVAALLRTDPPVLWALGVLVGDTPMPRHPDLLAHVNWVSTYLS